MGSFYGLEIAKTGLFISRQSIDLIGHNIANAATVGYTRQRLVTQSIDPASTNAQYAPIAKGAVGGGVQVQILDQIRSSYLDSEYRRENADLCQWTTRTESMEYIESLFDETSDTSISRTLADFFDSVNELSTDPVNKEIRTNLQQNALKLTETFNHYYDQLVDYQKVQNDSMKVTVDRVNELLTSLAAYNKQVFAYELSGEKANDLRDKRNLLLDELSGLVNITYEENTQGHLIVSVEGHELVNHTDVTKLEAVADQTGVVSSETGFYSIYYEGTTNEFEYSTGELAAYRAMRDGNTVDNIGIPRILDNLNTLARSLSKEFNAIHSTGYTMPNGSILSQTGINFFEVPSDDYDLVTAKTFCLSDEVLDSVYNIAASDKLIDLTASNDQKANNKIALKLVELSSSTEVPDVSNFENYLKSTIVEIALDSAYSQKMSDGQDNLLSNLDNRRQSVSGVSIDEEMVQMVKYQHAYSAASRVINAIDEELDILINKTGMVGR